MPLDRASTPGQSDSRFHRFVILVQPSGEALHGVHGTRGGALEPGIEALRLPLADEGGKVLRQVDGLGDCRRLRLQLGELLGLGLRALRLAPQHQPGRAAWRQGLARWLGHGRQGLPCAAVPGRQALGLPQTAGIGCDYTIAARIAPLAEVAKQSHRVVAPRIPALEEIRLIRVEATLAEVAATAAPGKGGAAEIALHRAQPQPDLLRNGRSRPALVVQGPDQLMQGLPAGLALRRALLRRQGDGVGWHGHGERPIGQGYGQWAHGRIDGIEDVTIGAEYLVQRFPKILEYMKAVRDLGRLGRALPSAFSIGTRAIARDDLHAGMLPEPLRQGFGRALWQQGHGLAALQVHQDRAIGVPFPQGEVIHPQHPGRGERRGRLLAEHAQQGVAAHHHVPRVAELHPSLPPKRPAEGDEALREPLGTPRPGGRHGGQAFGEDTTRTGAIAAKPLADAQLEAHPILGPGQIGEGALVVTMDTPGRGSAQRTGGVGLGRVHAQGELRRDVVDLTRLEAQARGIR